MYIAITENMVFVGLGFRHSYVPYGIRILSADLGILSRNKLIPVPVLLHFVIESGPVRVSVKAPKMNDCYRPTMHVAYFPICCACRGCIECVYLNDIVIRRSNSKLMLHFW